MYQENENRRRAGSEDLFCFEIKQGGPDLLLSADKDIKYIAEPIAKQARVELNKFIAINPIFESSLLPVKVPFTAPPIVKDMARAASRMKTGPMSAAAGAVAEYIGKKLIKHTGQLIIENSGNIYMKTDIPREIMLAAGKSPFSEKLYLQIDPADTPISICLLTSSPFSSGSADAVIVLSGSAVIAGACAAAIANMIRKDSDIDTSLASAGRIHGIKGILIIKGERMGIWGKIKIRSC